MTSVLPFLLVAAMAATALVLMIGIVGFAVSTKVNEEFATKLMATRVMMQGIAVALFALLVVTHGG